MDRCALFVDAGYVLADGAMAVHGTRHRDSVSWDYSGLLKFLSGLSRDRSGLPVLRCYWYEATVEGRRTAEHDTLADLAGLKLRLARLRPGRRDGVETEMHRDLTTLARNGAISDAILVSAEEDLAEVVAEVQDLGIRVILVHITADGNRATARLLRQECDDILEIGSAHLRPFADLIAGAEPARRGDEYPAGAYSGRPMANGHGPAIGAVTRQGLPAAALPAPPPSYPAPVVTEPQRPAQPPAGVRPAARQEQGSEPGQQRDQPGGIEPGGIEPDGIEPGGIEPGGTRPGPAEPGQARHDQPAGPQHSHPQPARAPGLHAAAQDQAAGAAAPLGAPTGPGPGPQAPQHDAGRPAATQRHGVGGGTRGYPPPGPPLPADLYPVTADYPRPAGQYPDGSHPPGRHPDGQDPDGLDPAGPYPAGPYPAGPYPDGRYPAGPYPGGQYPAGPYPDGPYSGPRPAEAQPPVPPPVSVSLADAVQAAHAEGIAFGQEVARDAPALWLEAVLARKPRMPSDLEARLLQGSALPIDSLLHDEVRHALRRGFWDAMERSRR